MSVSLIGRELGQYHVLGAIGRGGMAEVYRAVQTSIGREVAIKVLSPLLVQDPDFVDRFNREVRIISRLQHPHILPVYDFGQYEGAPYIVMAYVPGGTLTDYIQRSGGLPLDETIRLVDQMAGALDFAHRSEIVHRDFKPSNVLLDGQGNVFLSDFGIAKVTAETAQLTGSGLIGTPDYMAPEMGKPGGVTPLIDVYALAVTVYQMLSGQHPFRAETPMGVIIAHATQPVPDVRLLRPDLPAAVQSVIERGMAKEPTHRIPSAGALADGLKAAAAGEEFGPAQMEYTAKPSTRGARVPPEAAHPVQPAVPGAIPQGTEVVEQTSPRRTPWAALGLLLGCGGALLLAAIVAVVAFLSFGGGNGLGSLIGWTSGLPTSGPNPSGNTPAASTASAPTGLPERTVTSGSAAPRGTSYKMGDVIETDYWSLVILGWDTPGPTAYSAPETGHQWIRVYVIQVNRSSDWQYAGQGLTLTDDHGAVYEPTSDVPSVGEQMGMYYEILAASERISGTMGFEVPKEVTGLHLVFQPNPEGTGAVDIVDLGNKPGSVKPPVSIPGETPLQVRPSSGRIDFEGLELTIHGVSHPPGTSLDRPDTGNWYVVLDVSVRNSSSASIDIDNFMIFELLSPEGTRYHTGYVGSSLGLKELGGTVAPGQSMDGVVLFEVPQDVSGWILAYDPNRSELGMAFISLPD